MVGQRVVIPQNSYRIAKRYRPKRKRLVGKRSASLLTDYWEKTARKRELASAGVISRKREE